MILDPIPNHTENEHLLPSAFFENKSSQWRKLNSNQLVNKATWEICLHKRHVSIRDRSNYRTANSYRILAWISIIMTFCFIRTELRFLVKRIFRLIHPSTDLHSSRLMSRSRFSRLRTSIYDRLHSCLKTVHLALIGL